MNNEIHLSIIVPILNEESILWKMAEEVSSQMDDVVGPGRWQLVLANNGSTDSTPAIMERIVKEFPTTISLHLDKPNIGNAMRAGMNAAGGRWAYIMPADERDKPFFIWAWNFRDHYDLILGSKRADPTLNHQSPYRRVLSWGLNALLHLLVEPIVSDTHGQKFLLLEPLLPIIDRCVISRGQFDTEFTIRAVRAGLRVAEVPVVHNEIRPPRNLMVTKILRNIHDLLRLTRAVRNEPKTSPVRFHQWSRHDVMNLSLPSPTPTSEPDNKS